MPYKDKEKHKEYQRKRVARIRKEWFEENGPCKECGSWENLELHHKDPAQKVSHRIWSWAKEKRLAELSKCEVLCRECHINKTRKPITHGSDHKGYYRGCRCEKCKAAHAKRLREYRKKIKDTTPV
jgi:hypothetical protein